MPCTLLIGFPTDAASVERWHSKNRGEPMAKRAKTDVVTLHEDVEEDFGFEFSDLRLCFARIKDGQEIPRDEAKIFVTLCDLPLGFNLFKEIEIPKSMRKAYVALGNRDDGTLDFVVVDSFEGIV